MSKAFTRESDDEPGLPVLRASSIILPNGVKNYLTPAGFGKLANELTQLEIEPATPSNRQRIFELRESLQSAVVTAPPQLPWNQVLFGATVTVRNQNNEHFSYRLVGAAESDSERDHISWQSPLAKALLKKQVGDQVRFHAPNGEQTLELLSISYELTE